MDLLQPKTDRSKWIIIMELLFVAALCYFPLCYRIDALSLRQYDEARNAVNAIEMLENHHWLVRYFAGRPEVYEVKPPLYTWMQVISLKIFGFNELAIRFPSILASFSTVLFLIFYFAKYHKNRYAGYLAALILVTSQGYIDRHIARTGDHDALLILFTTVIIFLYYEFLASRDRKNHLLLLISILFTLGVLTKSISILFILPGLLITTFMFKGWEKLFSSAGFYFGVLIFLICSGSYYLVREKLQPGYLEAVWEWELFRRYFNTSNKFNMGSFWEYGINFFHSRFTYWIYFLCLSPLVLLIGSFDLRKLFTYLWFNVLIFFIVISSGSKGLWYDGPLFPLFSAVIALFIYYGMQYLLNTFNIKKQIRSSLAVILLLLIFIYPGITIMQKVSRPDDYSWDKERFALCYYLRNDQNVKKLPPGPVNIVFNEYTAHILFYVEAINMKAKREMITFKGLDNLQPDDVVMVSQTEILESIRKRFCYTLLDNNKEVYLLRLGKYLDSTI